MYAKGLRDKVRERRRATGTLFPVARCSEDEWPRGNLLVPGDTVWVLLESGVRQGEGANAKVSPS